MLWSTIEKVNWRKAVVQSAVLTIIAIALPLIALAFNFSPLQPVNGKGFCAYCKNILTRVLINRTIAREGFPITVELQGSNNLLLTQVR